MRVLLSSIVIFGLFSVVYGQQGAGLAPGAYDEFVVGKPVVIQHPAGAILLTGQAKDLGKAEDRLKAWKVAYMDGAEVFGAGEKDRRKNYRELIQKIGGAYREDQLAGKSARKLIKKILAVSVSKMGREKKLDLLEERMNEVSSELEDLLKGKVKSKSKTMTPKAKTLLWLVNEGILYAQTNDDVPKRVVKRAMGHLSDAEKLEARVKKDGEVSDREREKLEMSSLKAWGDVIKGVRKRRD